MNSPRVTYVPGLSVANVPGRTHGPYPLFWSGAIRGSQPSPEFLTYQRLFARRWMPPEWSETARIFSRS